MPEMIASLLRILSVSLGLLCLILLAIGLLVRQPTLGRYPFPDGPRADRDLLRSHVEFLCTQAYGRYGQNSRAIERAADYIKEALARTGADVTEQPYEAFRRPFRNIIARFGPAGGRRVIVGAHYDAAGEIAGADDNASGVAGLLELARLLAARKIEAPIELVAYATEEPPYFGGPEMGSVHHAERLRTTGVPVRGMICLEMIGYFRPRQPYSTLPLYLIYPRSGEFIAIAGRWEDRALVKELKISFRGATGVKAVSYSGPAGIGADLSDNRNYWAAGYPAVMVTDTAFLRNPTYHASGDVPATLDYTRMAGVVDGVLAAVVRLSSAGARAEA